MAQSKKEQARLRREADWQSVLSTPEGARVLGYLLAESGYHGVFYGGPDTHFTAYHEGRRSVGAFILRQVRVARPEALSTIILKGLGDEPGHSGAHPGSRPGPNGPGPNGPDGADGHGNG